MFRSLRFYLLQDYLRWAIAVLLGIIFSKLLHLKLANFINVVNGDPAQKSLSLSLLFWLIGTIGILYLAIFIFRQYLLFAKLADQDISYPVLEKTIILNWQKKLKFFPIWAILSGLIFQHSSPSLFLLLSIGLLIIMRNYFLEEKINNLGRLLNLELVKTQMIKKKMLNFNTQQSLLLLLLIYLMLDHGNVLKICLLVLISAYYLFLTRKFFLSDNQNQSRLKLQWNQNQVYLFALTFFTITLLIIIYFSDYLFSILNLIKKYT